MKSVTVCFKTKLTAKFLRRGLSVETQTEKNDVSKSTSEDDDSDGSSENPAEEAAEEVSEIIEDINSNSSSELEEIQIEKGKKRANVEEDSPSHLPRFSSVNLDLWPPARPPRIYEHADISRQH